MITATVIEVQINTFHFDNANYDLDYDKSLSKLPRNRSLNLNEITHSIDTCQNIYLLLRLSEKNLGASYTWERLIRLRAANLLIGFW